MALDSPSESPLEEECTGRLPGEEYSDRRDAIDALGREGSVRAVGLLVSLLINRSLDCRLRWRAARALGEIGDPCALDALFWMLEDEHPVVRWEAVIALGKIGGPAAIRSLTSSLSDESYYLRGRAARALIQLAGMPEPSLANLERLIELLSSGDEEVMRTIIKIGPSALPALREALSNDSFFLRRDVAQTLALYILGVIEDGPEGLPTTRLAGHGLSPESIAQLYDFRIIEKEGAVKRVETTNFERVSERLRGVGIIRLSPSLKGPPWQACSTGDVAEVDLGTLLSEMGADRPKIVGRTLVARADEGYLAIKLGVRQGDDARLLTEALVQSYLDHHSMELNLSSRLPHPLPPEEGKSYLFRLLGAPQALSNGQGLSKDPYAISYLAEDGYFTYLNDPAISMDELGASLAACAGDLASLIRAGVIHTSLIPLFHNREQINRRADRGTYRWWSKIAGRLDRWRESCLYPNLRLSGLADFEHVEFHSALSPGDLQHHIGDHLFSIGLLLGSYFSDKWQFDQEALSAIIRECFLAYHRMLTHTESPIDGCIDWDHLAHRMREEMEGDKYMRVIIRDGGPQGEDVEASTGPHLGLFNGPFPIPELIRAIHIASLFMVLEMQRSPPEHRPPGTSCLREVPRA